MMRRPILLITAILIIVILLYDSLAGHEKDLLEQQAGSTIGLTGTVEKVSMKDDDYYQVIIDDVTTEDGNSYDSRVLIQVYGELEGYLYMDGAVIGVSGEVMIPSGRSNPGCFDYMKYLRSIGIRVTMKTGGVAVIKEPEGMRKSMGILRGRVIESLRECPGDDAAGLMIGMIFGDKDYISDESMDMFRRGGTAHILAVSGLHIGIIYGFLLKFRRKKKSIADDMAIAAFLLFYAALCWFTASVMRAVIMILIHMAGNMMNRRYDFTCCICASMIAFLLIEPYQIFNTGFQMSYLAAFIMAFVLPVLGKRIKGMMGVIVTMQIGMGPYIAYVFNYVSVSAILCNIPVSILAAMMIPMGVIIVPLCMIGMEGPLSQVLGIMADVMIKSNEMTYLGGRLCFDCISPPIWILLMVYAFLFYFCSEDGKIAIMRRNRKRIFTILAACMIVSISAAVVTDDGYGRCEYTFVDVGQGDCLHISDGGMDVLIDGGGRYGTDVGEKVLKPYLLKNGTGHVDLAIATHLHMDHFQGLCELSQCYRIDTLAVYEGNSEDEEAIREKFRAKNIIYLEKGDEIKIGKRGCIRILAPENGSRGDEEDENAESLVIRSEIGGVSALMTGDIDETGELKVIGMNEKEDISCNVLKVAHHGSRYSSSESFMEAVSPDMAVISVGKNNYGHPAQETLDRLEERNIPTYRTDQQGAIGIDVDRKKVHTMK